MIKGVRMSEEDKRTMSRGYLRVPTSLIGVFMFMTTQTCAGIWWAGTTSATLANMRAMQESMIQKIENNTKDRYTGAQATVDFQRHKEVIAELKLEVRSELNTLDMQYKTLDRQMNNFQARYGPLLDDLEKRKE